MAKNQKAPSSDSAFRLAKVENLEEAFDETFFVQEDALGSRRLRQTWHGHDLTADRYNEAGSCRQANFADRTDVAGGRVDFTMQTGPAILGMDKAIAVAFPATGRPRGQPRRQAHR